MPTQFWVQTQAHGYELQALNGGLFAVTVPGALAVGPRSVPLVIPRSGRLTAVVAGLATSPLAGEVVADVNLNGTTIFTNQGNRPSVPAGANASGVVIPDVQDVAPGDVLTVDIDEIGQTTPEFIASASSAASAGHAILTRPEDVAAGDLIVAQIRSSYVAAAPATVTPPANWTEIGTQVNNASDSYSMHRFWKFDEDEATHDFLVSGAQAFAGGVGAWVRHALPGTPIDVVASNQSTFGTGVSVPTVTTSEANELLIAYAMMLLSGTLTTAPPGLVLRHPASAATSTNRWLWTQAWPEATATGARAGAFSTSDRRLLSSIAVRPDPDATGVERGTTLTLSIAVE